MADNSGIKSWKSYAQKLKSFFFSKDILSFLLFVLLSSAFWFVNVLGRERETDISIPVEYIGLPQNIIFSSPPPSRIFVSVKDQGLQLLNYSRFRLKPLRIDLMREFEQQGEIIFTLDQIRSRLNRYLLPSTTILQIRPDTMQITYEKLSEATLPITLVSKIDLAHQHIFSREISLEPSRITVYGPKKIIDSLKSVRTELLKAKNIDDTASYVAKLIPIESVRYSVNETKVTLYVEQFTEKKVQIPITAINFPENLSVRTFPTIVDATFIVGLSHFKDLDRDNIQVFIDYNDLKNDNQSKHKLTVKNNSPFISNIRITPQEVEFLLEQN